MSERDWSDIYNKLPLETRKICGIIQAQQRLRQLKEERVRVNHAYRHAIGIIDDAIVLTEGMLEGYEREFDSTET